MEHMENTHIENQSCGCGCGCAETHQAEVREADAAQEKAPRRAYAPAVDIIESENAVTLVADVPGVPKGGVELSLEKNILTLAAVPADGVIAGKKLIYSEYGVGEYRRSFALSEDVDKENITATLNDGVLRITLPKMKAVSRKISVSS